MSKKSYDFASVGSRKVNDGCDCFCRESKSKE